VRHFGGFPRQLRQAKEARSADDYAIASETDLPFGEWVAVDLDGFVD